MNASPTSIVAYLVLFTAVAFAFLLVTLFIGRLLRANVPGAQKLAPYECGEPPVGSSFIQFDLRFYVVALVFIIFEVEVAMFFPTAVVFGKATQVMKTANRQETPEPRLYDDLGLQPDPAQWGTNEMYGPADQNARDARTLALAAMADLAVFFAVILVGFAYVWWRGDLGWVRAIGRPATTNGEDGFGVQGSGFRITG